MIGFSLLVKFVDFQLFTIASVYDRNIAVIYLFFEKAIFIEVLCSAAFRHNCQDTISYIALLGHF